MEILNTMISSNLKIIGNRICEKCGSSVPIIQTIRDDQIVEVSECLTCDSNRVQDEAILFKKDMDQRKGEIIFEKYSLIPDHLKNANFNNYEPVNESTSRAKKQAIWYANHFDELRDENSLLFQGKYGVGKSHLSYAIANYLKSDGKVVLFVSMPDMLNLLRESYSKNDLSETEILEVCKNADLLIFDDMGAEYVKLDNGKESWAVDKIFTIVNSRMDKPNIFTTNYTSRELAAKYGNHGGRIVSRMMKGTKPIKIDAPDYRLKGW